MLPTATGDIQPVFILAGLFVPVLKVPSLTRALMSAKQRYFPGLLPANSKFMDWIKVEVKGSNLRSDIANGSTRQRKTALGYLDRLRDISRRMDTQLVGRAWIKGIGTPIDSTAIYTYSVQYILMQFEHFLQEKAATGIVVADSRNKGKNTSVSHSIFTQKYKTLGDTYPSIIEMPLFGHSDNHAGVQLCDAFCSAILTPMCIETYCVGHVTNVHIRTGYDRIKERYYADVRDMQYRYKDSASRWKGGLTVADALTKRHGGLLFTLPTTAPAAPAGDPLTSGASQVAEDAV